MTVSVRALLHHVIVAIALAGVTLVAIPAASARPEAVTVKPRAESWYRSTFGLSLGGPPTCDTPVGCGPALPPEVQSPPSPYPDGTLHVGVTAGFEDARTYITLDFSVIDSEILDGTLSLPVDATPESGTLAPETAGIRACLVTDFVVDGINGDLTGAPAVDCAVTADATWVPGEDDRPAVFRVDLAPFLDHWGPLAGALSLLPAEGAGPSDAWHVAFSRRDRDELDLLITATLEVAAAVNPDGSASTGTPPVTGVPGSPQLPFPLGPIAGPPSTGGADPGVAPPVVATDPPSNPPQVAPPLAFSPARGFAYPAVFLLPFLLATAGGWCARAFTIDLLPERN